MEMGTGWGCVKEGVGLDRIRRNINRAFCAGKLTQNTAYQASTHACFHTEVEKLHVGEEDYKNERPMDRKVMTC